MSGYRQTIVVVTPFPSAKIEAAVRKLRELSGLPEGGFHIKQLTEEEFSLSLLEEYVTRLVAHGKHDPQWFELFKACAFPIAPGSEYRVTVPKTMRAETGDQIGSAKNVAVAQVMQQAGAIGPRRRLLGFAMSRPIWLRGHHIDWCSRAQWVRDSPAVFLQDDGTISMA